MAVMGEQEPGSVLPHMGRPRPAGIQGSRAKSMKNDDEPKPYRPPMRGQRLPDILKQEITEPKKKDLFTVTINATQHLGRDCMKSSNTNTNNEHKESFCLEIVFKPIEPGLTLRPEETQLLLAYMGEILKAIEVEEKAIIEEEKRAAQEITARKEGE